MFRYAISLLICLFLPLVALSANYRLAPNPQPVSGDKIEVIEFFWYGCNHCYNLEPKMEAWTKTRKDVAFKRVHVPLMPGAVSMTKAFYTLAQMNELDKVHAKIFHAMHKENIHLDDAKVFLDWIGKQGVDAKKFKEIYDSFGINAKVKQAERLAATYRLSAVPMIVVDGKYITNPGMAQGEDFSKVLDELVAKAQADRKKSGK